MMDLLHLLHIKHLRQHHIQIEYHIQKPQKAYQQPSVYQQPVIYQQPDAYPQPQNRQRTVPDQNPGTYRQPKNPISQNPYQQAYRQDRRVTYNPNRQVTVPGPQSPGTTNGRGQVNVTVNRGQPQPVNRNEPSQNPYKQRRSVPNPVQYSFNVQNPYAERPNQRDPDRRRQRRNPNEVATADNRGEMFRFHRPHLDLRNKIVEVGKIVGKALRTPKLHKNRDLEAFKFKILVLFVLINKDQQTHSDRILLDHSKDLINDQQRKQYHRI